MIETGTRASTRSPPTRRSGSSSTPSGASAPRPTSTTTRGRTGTCPSTSAWPRRRNFLRSCEDVLGAYVEGDVVEHEGRRMLVTARPIGVDPAELDALASDEDVIERERALVASRPEQLVVRVDRTDPSKNVVR